LGHGEGKCLVETVGEGATHAEEVTKKSVTAKELAEDQGGPIAALACHIG